MATREVDEQEYLASVGVVQAVQSMLKHPEARKLVLKAQKTVNPNAVIPEIDAAAPLANELAGVTKRLDDIAASIAADKAARDAEAKVNEFATAWGKQKAKLRDAGYYDDAIEAIEKLAQERGIPDLEAAAALHEKLHPPASPASPSGFGTWNFLEPTEKEGEFTKKLLETKGDDDGALRSEINKALADVRGQRRAA